MDANRFSGPIWSLFRIVVGLLFSFHGMATVFGFFGGNPGTKSALDVGQWPGWWAGLIQVVCGLLVMIGLFTRPAAVLSSGSMAYAYFVMHQPDGLLPIQNGGVSASLYAWAFLVIAALGAGSWSLDELLRRRSAAKASDDAASGAGASSDAGVGDKSATAPASA